jgi:1-acyl-sn-glycerol-3-phosphate acyltransferase
VAVVAVVGGVAPRGGPVSTTLTRRPRTSTVRVSAGQSTSIQVESSPSAYVSSAPGRANACQAAALTCSVNPGTPLPYRPRMPRAELPAPDPRRAYLPAIEPERQVTDWGRSERVEGLMDRTVYDFLYHYWFRVEVEGIEHVPSTGGALLVSNHAGAMPPDGSMIAKAIKEEHSRPRPLHMTVEHFFKGYPWLSMLVPKVGGVPAHPANVHRLLYDEEQLVLVFPEGAKGTEKLYKDRYRLRRFGRGGFVEAAMRAKAPIVPIAVVGAEEAQPIFAHLPLRRLTGLLYAPLAPLVYLPAKFFIRFLEPIPTDVYGEEPWLDAGLVQTVAEDVRARIQEELYEMLARRRSAWLG